MSLKSVDAFDQGTIQQDQIKEFIRIISSTFGSKVFKILSITSLPLCLSATPAGADENNLFGYQRYIGYLDDAGYEIVDISGFELFAEKFSLILDTLEQYGLIGEDINDAMNLYSSWMQRGNNREAFIMAYRYFLGSFPNPEIHLRELLASIGITLEENKKS